MQLIFDENFTAGQLPLSWYTDTAFPKYTAGEWDCRNGDGVIIPLPHDVWRALRLEIELTGIGPNATAFGGSDGRTALSIDLGNATSARHSASDGGLVITQSTLIAPLKDNAATVVFEWSADTMRALVGEEVILTAPNLRRSARAGSFHTGFRDCIVRRITAFGEAMTTELATPQAVRPEYPLEVTIDFNDDLMSAAWTHQTFENLFQELKSWGTKTVSWIDLGREEDEYFSYAAFSTGVHGKQTFENVGDMFTAAADHAHQHGIEFIGILKPYDMAIHGISVPLHYDEEEFGIRRIGGSSMWRTRMAKENQHLLTARKPSVHGPAKNEVWTQLHLVKDDDGESEVSPEDISLIVSDDNETFREYPGPITRSESVEEYPLYQSTPSGPKPTGETRRSRVLRFENLEIREPFFAIEVKGSARSFSNRLHDLVHLFGENGEETHFTYGLLPRRAGYMTLYLGEAIAASTRRDGAQGGFEFDRYPGSPASAMSSGGDPINTPLALDRGANSFIAFARGKDRSPLAVMSPSFPETRKLWLTWVEAMLDSGADGIDLRPGHHHSDFSWIEYGFEEPVRNEMLKRTGVDIWETDDFDYEMWRKIRGDGWTQFLREASTLVRSRGKKFTAHIDSYFDNPPGLGAAMNMVTDWRSWIEKGLLDGVIAKAVFPNSSFSYEVLALAHSKGIPVTFAPYCNNFFEAGSAMNHVGDSPVGCEVPVDQLIEWGKRGGYDGFLFYECGSALRAEPDGSVDFRANAEPLRGVMQKYFGQKNGFETRPSR